MTFAQTPAASSIKKHLIQTFLDQRVSHAQLFFGAPGSGKLGLAIAYAQLLNCSHPVSPADACGTCPSCVQYQKLAHPDLHFFFPTSTSKSVSRKPNSKEYIAQWRDFLLQNHLQASLPAWYEFIGIENKQGTIYKDDAQEINRILGYKSYESEFKIVIVWMIEKLYHSAAPKLLKILEEPPEKTLFLLISEHPDQIISTIHSRCTPIKIPRIPDEEMIPYLIKQTGCSADEASLATVQAEGNYQIACNLIKEGNQTSEQFEVFRNWMRLCFSHKVPELIAFSQETGKNGREQQKRLLQYGLSVACRSISRQYLQKETRGTPREEQEFLAKFSPFLTPENLPGFYQYFNDAMFHIERNAYAPTLFLDLSLQISRLIKQ